MVGSEGMNQFCFHNQDLTLKNLLHNHFTHTDSDEYSKDTTNLHHSHGRYEIGKHTKYFLFR